MSTRELVSDSVTLPAFPHRTREHAQRLCDTLKAHGLSIVTAESCTSGLLAASMASACSGRLLVGSFVTYRPSLKIAALHVSYDLIADRTVYDPEVARQMAIGALRAAPEADLALATTGVAGPGPDQGKPAGLVFIAAALRDQEPNVRACQFAGAPQEVIAAAINMALQMGVNTIRSMHGNA